MANIYEKLVTTLPNLLGGKDNIQFFTHCATRLRFTVKNKELVKQEDIKNLSGVISDNWSGDQYQIIIGNAVGDVYQQLNQAHQLNKEDGGAKADTKQKEDTEKWKRFNPSQILDFITGCVTPILPLLMAGGFIKLLVTLSMMAGILDDSMSTVAVLNAVGDSAFYFLPIFVAGNAADKLGANRTIAMMVGAMLIHPNMIDLLSNGNPLTIFSLPIYPANYVASVIAPILCIVVMAPIQKYIAKSSPLAIRSITEPFLTVLIMIPLALCLLGPVGAFLSTYVVNSIVFLYETFGFVGVAIFAAIQPLLVATGMHQALIPYLGQIFASLGYEHVTLPAIIVANINQGTAGLAVALKSKDKQTRQVAMSGALTALLGGITEPILYGINLKHKTPMIAVMIGGLVGGSIVGLAKAAAHVLNGGGLLTIPVLIGEHTGNLMLALLGILAGSIATFVMTLILYKEIPVVLVNFKIQ